jgi:hypothetical protein
MKLGLLPQGKDKLRVSGKNVVENICTLLTGKIYSDELHNLYLSSNVIRVTKSRGIR